MKEKREKLVMIRLTDSEYNTLQEHIRDLKETESLELTASNLIRYYVFSRIKSERGTTPKVEKPEEDHTKDRVALLQDIFDEDDFNHTLDEDIPSSDMTELERRLVGVRAYE